MRNFAKPSIIVFLIGAFALCLIGSGFMTKQSPVPVVRASLGVPFEEVQRRSTFRFKLKDISEYHTIPIQGPVRFEYRNSKSRNVFPLARFLALHLVQGKLTSATVDPLPNPTNLDDAMKVAGDALEKLQANGWTTYGKSKPPSLELARKRLTEKSANLEMTAIVGTLSQDGDWLQIRVKRMWGDEDKFVVAVDIQNGTVIREQTRQSLTHRRIVLSPVVPATE